MRIKNIVILKLFMFMQIYDFKPNKTKKSVIGLQTLYFLTIKMHRNQLYYLQINLYR